MAYWQPAGLEYAMLSLMPFYPLAVIALVLVARSLARQGFSAGAAQT